MPNHYVYVYRGARLKLREMKPDETIDELTFCLPPDEPLFTNGDGNLPRIDNKLLPSNSQGQTPADHPGRRYFHVESKFVKSLKD